jgi:hypothetical protein
MCRSASIVPFEGLEKLHCRPRPGSAGLIGIALASPRRAQLVVHSMPESGPHLGAEESLRIDRMTQAVMQSKQDFAPARILFAAADLRSGALEHAQGAEAGASPAL